MKYQTASKHYRVRCNETLEEQTFDTEKECVEWAKKVALTFSESMTFAIIRITEKAAEVWAQPNGEFGEVR